MKDQWLINHERRIADGTYRRIDAVVKNRTPVQIKRSSGEMVTGYVASNPGVVVVVVWGVGAADWWMEGGNIQVPRGVMNKRVDVDDLIALNPWLGANP